MTSRLIHSCFLGIIVVATGPVWAFTPPTWLSSTSSAIGNQETTIDKGVNKNGNHNNGKRQEHSFLEKLDRFLTRLQGPLENLQGHTYLSGNYAPVADQHVELNNIELIEGSIPSTLNGMFVRNGPNPIVPTSGNQQFQKLYHWFDGHAMLHTLRLQDGEAVYSNQFVPSVRYQVERDLMKDDNFFPTLGEYQGIWGLFKILFHPTMVRARVPNLLTVAPPNTNVVMYNDRFYCLNEANLPFECKLLPDGTLEPVGYETFGDQLDYPVSAHPRVHPTTGDFLFHSYTTNTELIERDGTMKVGRYHGPTNTMKFYFVPNRPNHQDYVSFAHGMVHSENYLLLWDCSVHFDPMGMFEGGSFFRTKETHNLRFGLVPVNATSPDDVVWIDTGAKGAVVHPLNAWEEFNATTGVTELVLWTPFCDDLIVDLESDDINRFNMVEYRFDPSSGTLLAQTIIDTTINIEFSAVHQMGQFTRYGYTAIQDPSTPGEGSFSGFAIWDMSRGTLHQTVYYPDGQVGGEPLVATDETTGVTYVATYLFDQQEYGSSDCHSTSSSTYFALYDGASGNLVCKMRMPVRVPFGFHGSWFSLKDLEGHFRYHGIDLGTTM